MAKDKSGGGDGAQSKSGGWGLVSCLLFTAWQLASIIL
jgi:hypothetical protein